MVAAGVVAVGAMGGGFYAQAPAQAPAGAWMSATPTNDAPNPYNTIEGWAKLPEGRDVGLDERRRHRQGRQEHLGGRALRRSTTCWDRAKGEMSPLQTVFKFDSTGKMVASFGAGHDGVPARHPRRSRRQHLGDRRQQQPARARAPVQPADAPLPADAGEGRRATRSSSSAPTARCC